MTQVQWLNRPDGVHLAYIAIGEGAGPRMVFAHSLTATGTGAGPFLQPFVDDGWTVAAPDQRGHGRSPVTDPALLSVERCAGDLIAVMDDQGWPTAWLAGGSMGAAPALAAAVASPDRVEGLVLLAPAFSAEPNPARDDFAAVADALDEGGFRVGAQVWRKRMVARGAPDAAVDGQIAQLAQHDVASLACFLRTIPAWTLPDVMSRVHALDMPVVVLAWTGDDVHPFSLAAEIASAAPRGSLVEIEPAAMAQGPAGMLAVTRAALRPHVVLR